MTKNYISFAYTRKQAIADGVIVDASTVAREAGFVIPVAMTFAAWAECVAVSPEEKCVGQDNTGRLWDVLNLLRAAIHRPGAGGTAVIHFKVSVQRENSTDLVSLKAVCGPDDDAAACITIMLPNED